MLPYLMWTTVALRKPIVNLRWPIVTLRGPIVALGWPTVSLRWPIVTLHTSPYLHLPHNVCCNFFISLNNVADELLNILNVQCTLQAASQCQCWVRPGPAPTWTPIPSVCWLPAACLVSWNNDTAAVSYKYQYLHNSTIPLQLKYCRPAGDRPITDTTWRRKTVFMWKVWNITISVFVCFHCVHGVMGRLLM